MKKLILHVSQMISESNLFLIISMHLNTELQRNSANGILTSKKENKLFHARQLKLASIMG